MKRVIPRDLFNDANLLKCYGQLYLELEKIGKQDCLQYAQEGLNTCSFTIRDSCDGETWLSLVNLFVPEFVPLYRPMNSRGPYPLYARIGDGDSVAVFNDDGTFTQEFKDLLTGEGK